MMGNRIVIEGRAGAFGAYIAQPAALPAPGVVVLQEVFGVNADIRKTCDELAEQGFIAVAPDLFWRQEPGVDLDVTSEPDWQHGLRLYQAYNRDAGVEDIKDTVGATATLPDCTGKVAVMGFCLDGAEPGREPPTQTSQDSSGECHRADSGTLADGPQHNDIPAPPFPENPDTVKPDPEKPDPINPHLTKEGKKQKTDLPPDPPKSPGRSGAKPEPPDRMAFDRFWEAWPLAERPRNRDLVEQLFNTLTPTERNHASIYAGAYRAQGAKHGQPAHMIPYLKAQRFTEFIGAPPLNDGYFVITPDREEWAPWLGHLQGRHSERIIAEQAAKGFLRTPTRWPPPS